MLHGEGRYTWPSGETYLGQFCDSTLTGLGVLRWSDGSEYRGNFVRGLRDGEGEFSFGSNGATYKGQWERGQRSGRVRRWGAEVGCAAFGVDGAKGAHVLPYRVAWCFLPPVTMMANGRTDIATAKAL